MATASRRLALFDLDGTLSRHDTFKGFVAGLLREHPTRWLRAPLLAFPIAGYALKLVDRGGLKGAILHQLFNGLPRADIEAFARRYAAEVVPARMFAETVKALREHLRAGDHVVLLSASPDLYVPEIGKLLGVHETICTQIRWNGEHLDGRLAGPNRRDHEKLRVLEQLRAAHPGLPVIAYGNSVEDLIHMQRSEDAVYVNPHPRMAAVLRGRGIRYVHWR